MKQNQLPVQDSPKELAVYAAVLQLAGQGVDLASLRVQQIADAAGMGKGTLYEYFKSKEEILRGTVSWCLRDELRQLTELTAGAQSMDELLEGGEAYILGLVTGRIEAYRIMGGLMKSEPAQQEGCALEGLKDVLQAMLAQDYRMAQRTGWLKETVDEAYFGYVLLTSMISYAMALATVCRPGTPGEAGLADCREYFRRSVRSCLMR